MKKVAKLLIFSILLNLFMPYLSVFALTNDEISSRDVCGVNPYEVAIANTDGSLTNSSCHINYQDAKTTMDNHLDDNAVLLHRVNGYTSLIDAKYAFLDMDRGEVVTNIYTDSSFSTSITYMNNYYAYGGTDASLIERLENGSAKIKISNIVGWVKNGTYTVIPLAWTNSINYYNVTDQEISHCYIYDLIESDAVTSCNRLSYKPEQLNVGKYYSYDGIYYYQDKKTMLQDYKNNNYNQAVNSTNPYYNYYQYLPQHSKTTYSSLDIDEYIRITLNKKGTVYGGKAYSNYSMLYGQGAFFYNAQELYGINALSIFSLARHESGTGTSRISIDKNNGFGHGAVDSDPYYASDGYLAFAYGIYSHAYDWMTYGYSEAIDSRYHGGVFGNKGIGANVQYASDPYWGEKAAGLHYLFDLANGGNDYNYYQLAVSSYYGIYARTEPNTSSKSVYQIKEEGIPIIIVEEVQGESINGNTTWYKIMSDINLDENKNVVAHNSANRSTYNWENNYVYVSSNYFTKINSGKNGAVNPNTTYSYQDQKYTYEYYQESQALAPKVAVANGNIAVYYDATLLSRKDITITKDAYFVVFASAKDENNEIVSYLVSTDYQKNQKEWIKASDLVRFIDKTLGKTNLPREWYQEVYNNTVKNTSNQIGSIFGYTYVPILEEKTVDGNVWLKVPYNITGSTNMTGWMLAKDDPFIMEYTMVVSHAPEIEAEDKLLLINSTFDPLSGVSAKDIEDGNITSKITIVSNNVNLQAAGTYSITYQVIDSDEKKATKTINVVVSNYQEKNSLFYYESFEKVSNDNFEVKGFLAIEGMDNTIENDIKHTLILEGTNGEIYRFNLDRWTNNYPFEMDNINDDKIYNYNGGWFKDTIDLSNVAQGDYIVYVEVTNGFYITKCLFNNIFSKPLFKTETMDSGRSYEAAMNYYKREMPLEIFIRDLGLIARKNTPTNEAMFNAYEILEFDENFLNIRGTSHSYKVDYSKRKNIDRSIIFENTKTFDRITFDNIGSITNGDYDVILRVDDGLDKTKAWYDGKIDLSKIKTPGVYAIFVKTISDNIEDFGELRNIMITSLDKKHKIGDLTYTLKLSLQNRSRIELVVE